MKKIVGGINYLLGFTVFNKLVVIIAGCILTLAYAPFCRLFVVIISFPLLLWATEKCRSRVSIFLNGFLFGFFHYLTSLYWMTNPLGFFGTTFESLKLLALFGIPLALAVLTGTQLLLYSLLFKGDKTIKVIGFASLWMVYEMVRTYCILPFPWNIVGYTLASDDVLLQVVNITGLLGASFLVVLIGSSLYTMNGRFIIAAVLVVVSAFAFGKYRLANVEVPEQLGAKIAVIQPNSQPYMPTPVLQNTIFQKFIKLSESEFAKKPMAVIWPESAFPYDIDINETGVLNSLLEALPKEGVLIFGTDRSKGVNLFERYFFNSLIMLDLGKQEMQYYDKEILVPFGEYIPYRDLFSVFQYLGLFHALVAPHDFTNGVNISKVYHLGTLPKFLPLICYEILFPHVMAFNEDPDWLLNISNDGWFGNTKGPYQHLYMAKLRAVEYGIPVVRAATTGISAVIDSYGRIIEKVEYGKSGVIETTLPKKIGNPYYIRVLHIVFSVISLSLFIIMFIIERNIIKKRK